MLRWGKNPNEDKIRTQASTDSSSARNYSPSQSGETRPRPAIEAAAAPKALTESETITGEIKDGTLSGFVASGTSVTGEATFKGLLRIDGHFSGRITSTSGSLIVGAGGRVDAKVEVAVATIQGIVNGDVVATERIELGRAAKLSGNIRAPALVIEQGAVFEGSCKMVQQAGAVDKPAKVERKESVSAASSLPAGKVDAPLRKFEAGTSKDVASVLSVAAAS
jgi:cytoskeletal protein CcmA (bactofilin family)